jgi:hypothetical protein
MEYVASTLELELALDLEVELELDTELALEVELELDDRDETELPTELEPGEELLLLLPVHPAIINMQRYMTQYHGWYGDGPLLNILQVVATLRGRDVLVRMK